MKFRGVCIFACAFLGWLNAPGAQAQSLCTGTYGAGDYNSTYTGHRTRPDITAILTVPSLSAKVTGLAEDTVLLNVGRKNGVAVGDKFRIERPLSIQDGDGERIVNQVIGEVSITRVDDTHAAGMLLTDNVVNIGDSACSTSHAPRMVPSTYDLPPALSYGDRPPAVPRDEPRHYASPTRYASGPRVASLPPSATSLPPSETTRVPAEPYFNRPLELPDPTSVIEGDYLSEIPRAELDMWAAGHETLKVYVASGDHVRGYRPEFGDFVRQSFKEWTKASQNKLQFQYIDDESKADIDITWTYDRSGLTGRHELGITNTLRGDGGIEKAEVRLLTSASVSGKHITDSAMWITSLHEIGHALGLNHSHNPHDVMSPELRMDPRGETTISGLTARDVSSISHLYGDTTIHAELVKRHEQAIASTN